MTNASDRLADLLVRLRRGRPLVMGVLNVTPDSFSDGGRFDRPSAARAQAEAMHAAGADIIDIGGESTRPGAQAVDLEVERARVLPAIEAVVAHLGCPVSVDTSKPELMADAVAAGAVLVNDVRALAAPGAIPTMAGLDAAVCLMHMQGEPRTMQADPHYADVTREVGDFLAARAEACREGGIDPDRLLLDPGFGFGKTLAHNLALLAGLDGLVARLDHPLLVGLSRKRMIGELTGEQTAERRVHGSVAAAVLAVARGARVVRVHDVEPTRQAVAVAHAVRSAGEEST